MPYLWLHNENNSLGEKNPCVLVNVSQSRWEFVQLDKHMSWAYLPLYFFCSDSLKKKKPTTNPVLAEPEISSLHEAHMLLQVAAHQSRNKDSQPLCPDILSEPFIDPQVFCVFQAAQWTRGAAVWMTRFNYEVGQNEQLSGYSHVHLQQSLSLLIALTPLKPENETARQLMSGPLTSTLTHCSCPRLGLGLKTPPWGPWESMATTVGHSAHMWLAQKNRTGDRAGRSFPDHPTNASYLKKQGKKKTKRKTRTILHDDCLAHSHSQ